MLNGFFNLPGSNCIKERCYARTLLLAKDSRRDKRSLHRPGRSPSPGDARGLVVLEGGRVVALDRAARERELVLGVAYALLQFTPSVVDADEAVVVLDVTAGLRLFHGIRALARVPLIVAPDARRYANWFEDLGCETLADLQRLPRAGLKKRCGTQLLDWLDQVAGTAPAAYDWLETPPSFDTRVELMDRVEHAEALLFVARRLILQLTGWLTAT